MTEPDSIQGIPQLQTFVCLFVKLMEPSVKLAELPLHDLAFATVLNGAGSWSGTLDVEDEQTRAADWITATNVWRTMCLIMLNDKIMGGGPVTGRDYTMSTGKVALTGGDPITYLSQRLPAEKVGGKQNPYAYYLDPRGFLWNTAPPSFTIEKLQRIEGEETWHAGIIQCKVGEKIEYKVIVKNTGGKELEFDAIKDDGLALTPSGKVTIDPEEEQAYTGSHTTVAVGIHTNLATIKGNEGTGTKSSQTVEVKVNE
jgi:hypothetical protein